MATTARAQLLGPAEIRDLANRLGLRPTKTLGQNFVHDPNTVRRIVRAAALDPADVVVEVGPGLGSLTLALLPACRRVYAVEIDPILAAALPETVRSRAGEYADRLTVLAADALRLRAGQLPDPPPTALVANLPYNVAVPVLLHLLGELPSLRHGLVMVQREVADRLTAGPGGKLYGVPSVKLAWYGAARPAGRVPANVFWPVPNVESGLVAFSRHEPAGADAGRPQHGGAARQRHGAARQDDGAARQDDGAARQDDGAAHRDAVFAVVDAAFAQRRKTLRAALAGWAGDAPTAERVLRKAGVDPAARGETLSLPQFVAIAAAAEGTDS